MAFYYGFKPYVRVADRRRLAAAAMAKRAKKGDAVSPVVVEGRAIAKTFWGKAWCDNLESYSDYANRLPRGRTYVRNGSVVNLQIGAGRIDASVMGSELYEIQVKITPLPRAHWKQICGDCAGGIDSLVELLQGRFSKGVMERICERRTGLFPSPKEIVLECSCPDWASMCKHVAAVLYGIGARLDEKPELLFRLREVDEKDLLVHAGSAVPLAKKAAHSEKVIADADLSALFGLEMAPDEAGADRAAKKASARRSVPPKKKPKSRAASSKRRATPRKAAKRRR